MDRKIGEEIDLTFRQKENFANSIEYSVDDSFRTINSIFFMRSHIGFAMLIVSLALLSMPLYFLSKPGGLFIFFLLFLPMFFSIIFSLLFVYYQMKKVLKNNYIKLKDGSMIITHQHFQAPKITNVIDIKEIDRIDTAPKDLFKGAYKSNIKDPKTSAGGLCFNFCDQDELMVLYLKKPVKVLNYSILKKKMDIKERLSNPKEYEFYVKEIIIGISHSSHEKFLKNINKILNSQLTENYQC